MGYIKVDLTPQEVIIVYIKKTLLILTEGM
jgi:hypothetical protein